MERLVSVVLPVYNGERYLAESIESILNQTYTNWELIIVDDCSSDSTESISRHYVEMDKRIFYYRNPQNLRLPSNLNKGFSLAKGDYLTWTSDDNRYKPHALSKMVSRIEKDKVDFVYASFDIIDEDGNKNGVHEADEENMKKIVGENPVGACFLYTRTVYTTIGGYDPEYALVEDFDYWQRIFARFKVGRIMDSLYDYRYHNNQLTNTMKKEQFYKIKEQLLLKNRVLFKRISLRQQYYYYLGLTQCQKEIGEENNKYKLLLFIYSIPYYVEYVLPHYFKRIIARKKNELLAHTRKK